MSGSNRRLDLTSKGTAKDVQELRVVLLGQTGSGKSSTGNTILGRDYFRTGITSQCRKCRVQWGDTEIAVIDTPGLFDNDLSEEVVKQEIKACICLSSPGPHAFLLVIPLWRYDKWDMQAMGSIMNCFDGDAYKHTIVLFTHRDALKGQSIEAFVQGSVEAMKLVEKFGNRYHAFNNQDMGDRVQVQELLQKVKDLVSLNGGYYTSELYQMAEQANQQRQTELLMAKLEWLHCEHRSEVQKLKDKCTSLENNWQQQEEIAEQELQERDVLQQRLKCLEEQFQRDEQMAKEEYKMQTREEAERWNSFTQEAILVSSLIFLKIFLGAVKGVKAIQNKVRTGIRLLFHSRDTEPEKEELLSQPSSQCESQ
ncbi:GTPase IMAP family member 4-like [Polypterus senegalus]|uniref:GTPase IMAP family member 4-like n=1 Tax=Polypterus senegalus TaxID=55291 RepID=UPI00196249A4|nr:GTPase IMAP family member 4-like [Polypterus senegalus]